MRTFARCLMLFTCLSISAAAQAQGTITGVVRDTSGAVLPGVTVEAASPALIEKVRTVVTDGTGQYRIVDLRPGTYSVVFTLPGFNTVKREGIELEGSFTASVNADLRVGALEETITVTGETPTVDVQSATRQQVLNREIIETIPTGRSPYQLGALIPGVVVTGSLQDVGGSGGAATGSQPGANGSMRIHGSRNTDQLIMQNGITATDGSGYINTIGTNPITVQEIVYDTAAVSVESNGGGVRINVIPRDGGNVFNGSFFGSFMNDALQANNFDARLKSLGLATGDRVKSNWDVNPGFGGPLKRDRLWFYVSTRVNEIDNYAAGAFYNRNANNLNAWTFDPDVNQPLSNDNNNKDGQLRLSWQATPKNKVGFIWHEEANCFCPGFLSPLTSIEASLHKSYPVLRSVAPDWTSPVTSRLLLEAGAMYYYGRTNWDPWPELNPAMISVTEQSTGLQYRSGDGGPGQQYSTRPNRAIHSRAAMSYITGAHSLRIGYNNSDIYQDQWRTVLNPVTYRVNNGIPNQITQFAYGGGNDPLSTKTNIDWSLGVFAQDKWTIKRLTATYGLRWDYYLNRFPEQTVRPALFAPSRNITFPAQDDVNWKDLSPRLGAVYDLFGSGKTAVKVSLNKYLESLSMSSALINGPNPTATLVNSTTRSWSDANRNFIPECDLLNKAANGECGAMANQNFGTSVPGTVYDPKMMNGWGKRGYNWEFSAGVQQELLPNVSVDVGYFRRWYGNFKVTDNLTVAPTDFSPFSVTAPVDVRLPGGGGYVIPGLYNLNPDKFGLAANNFVTQASNYGEQTEYWHGVDVTVNARPRSGLLMQGGISTGRTVTDNCGVVTKLDSPSTLYCHAVTNWAGGTQGKLLASYTVPRVDVLVSGTFQSVAGPQLAANYNAPNALVAPSLGRPLSGGAANVTVNLVAPGAMFGERVNQLDLRVGKMLRYGKARTTVNVDFYNAFNANTILTENSNFGAWRQPTNILQARVVKFSFQFDY